MTFKTTQIQVVCDKCGCFKENYAENENEAFLTASINRGFRLMKIINGKRELEQELMLCLTCLVSMGLVDAIDHTGKVD